MAAWARGQHHISHHQLPALVRRLILATVPMPSLPHMPSGSSVSRPGWDGLLVVEKGNAWVPDGASAWEFSRARDPRRKATDDYNKRTTDPKGVDTPTTTFVFVTPRKWDGKLAWVNERQEEGPWADVHAEATTSGSRGSQRINTPEETSFSPRMLVVSDIG